MATENAKENAQQLNQEMQFILDAVVSIGDKLNNSFKDAVDDAVELGNVTETLGNTLKRGYSKDLRDVAKTSEELIKAQARQNKGLLKSSEIEKLKSKLLESQALKEARVSIAKANGVELDEKQLEALNKQIGFQEEVLAAIEEENKARGITGSILDKIKQKVNDLRLNDLATSVLTYTTKLLKEFDTEVANVQQGFALTKREAIAVNEELARSSLSARTLGVNLETVTKATNDLNNALGGTANLFTTDIRNGIAFAEERLGLSAEAASNLAIEAINSGKAFNDVVAENEAAFKAIRGTTGVALNFRQTLEEANQISGALRLNLEQSPGGLIEAVAQAKSLGIELDKIRGIQSGILDFEQSIAAELKAEALIGRDINLERARLFALNNDIAGLTQEIANQFGSIEEFQKLNFIQQKAFADAANLSSDELADILRTQESINNTIQTGVETQGESLTQNSAALSAQDALAQSITALNTTLKSSLAILAGIAAAAAIILAIPTGGLSLGALGTLTALQGGLIGGAAIGGGVAAVMDGTAPSQRGPFTITDSYGATAVTAKGDNVVVSPNVSQGGSSDGITKAQASEMISLLKQVANKDFSINMDGRKLNAAMESSGVAYNI